MSKIRQIKTWYRNIPILRHGIIKRYYQRLTNKNKRRFILPYRKLDLL